MPQLSESSLQKNERLSGEACIWCSSESRSAGRRVVAQQQFNSQRPTLSPDEVSLIAEDIQTVAFVTEMIASSMHAANQRAKDFNVGRLLLRSAYIFPFALMYPVCWDTVMTSLERHKCSFPFCLCDWKGGVWWVLWSVHHLIVSSDIWMIPVFFNQMCILSPEPS